MGKILVTYFSASGNTAAAAKRLAGLMDADMFEITPAVPYTAADLDWRNKQSRSSLEMSDPNSRPKINGRCDNISYYDTLFIGFPIWWYVAPTVVNTFLESCCLSGKTVIPFATSGSSGMGKTNERLAPSCPGANLREGKVIRRTTSDDELKQWLRELGIHDLKG